VGKIRLQFLDSDIALRESLMREQVERINARLIEGQSGSAPRAESPEAPEPPEETSSAWYDKWMDGIENAFLGGVREEPGEMQKRVTYSPSPAYPALARQAGIQGIVRLQVRVSKEGRVEVLKILEGEPVLANAAIAAVKQWRYKKALVNKQPVNVISEVTFNFQLH
jgi:TonB family protein